VEGGKGREGGREEGREGGREEGREGGREGEGGRGLTHAGHGAQLAREDEKAGRSILKEAGGFQNRAVLREEGGREGGREERGTSEGRCRRPSDGREGGREGGRKRGKEGGGYLDLTYFPPFPIGNAGAAPSSFQSVRGIIQEFEGEGHAVVGLRQA
jgi:hypothetical protein